MHHFGSADASLHILCGMIGVSVRQGFQDCLPNEVESQAHENEIQAEIHKIKYKSSRKIKRHLL